MQIVFEGVVGRNGLGNIAIDDISIAPGVCPTAPQVAAASPGDCSFEDDECGWQNPDTRWGMVMMMMMMMVMMMKTIMMIMMIRDNVDELQWERKAAADGVRFPVNDHTTGRGGDIYSLHTTPHPCRQRGRVLHAPVPRQHSEGGRPSLLREPGDGREPHRPLHVLLVSAIIH